MKQKYTTKETLVKNKCRFETSLKTTDQDHFSPMMTQHFPVRFYLSISVNFIPQRAHSNSSRYSSRSVFKYIESN